ncbi:putative Zn-dependent hydrolases of the beta-lactamase protein [Phyllosticta citricarpa]
MSTPSKSRLNITHIGTATAILETDSDPGLGLDKPPPIDVVLLSHEDHVDNLDDLGRRLPDGRKVLPTTDGAKNLAPRPAVHGMRLWETIADYESFGSTIGKPNAIWFSGDTVWIPELAEIRNKYHVLAAVLNLGGACSPSPFDIVGPEIDITMDGKQGAPAVREIGADVLVPMHFAEWELFKQHGKELREAFEAEGIMDKVCWSTQPMNVY